jgi:hypothetical protein
MDKGRDKGMDNGKESKSESEKVGAGDEAREVFDGGLGRIILEVLELMRSFMTSVAGTVRKESIKAARGAVSYGGIE